MQPQIYFLVTYAQSDHMKILTDSAAQQIDNWSKVATGTAVTKLDAKASKLTLDSGKELSYKALVLGTGFQHETSFVEGLTEMDKADPKNNVHVHILDGKDRPERNFFNGYFSQGGDYLCYSPKAPYKGEGTDFYALYYESILRNDQLLGTAAKGSRIQYWTPNKEIFKFPYANEVALEECAKRGIEVVFGWELLSVRTEASGVKVATFKNVDTGATTESEFFGAAINPPSKPVDFLQGAGVTDSQGLVDVNRYTLQHKKFENIFAIGDCIGGETTRTYTGGISQNPIVKHNVLQFLHGRELNAIYDGYQYMPLLLGSDYAAGLSHLHDFEPAPTNDSVPHYGLFANLYMNYVKQNQKSTAVAYGNSAKTHGPPHTHYAARYDPLEQNEYLLARQIPLEEVRHPNAQARALEPAV